jgi:signal peptidase II
MSGERRGSLPWLALSALVLLLDQWSKHLVETLMRPYEVRPVVPVLDLVRARNPGVAFSFFADGNGWQRWFFSALAAAVAVGILVWLMRLDRRARVLGAALALVFAGAVGNLIDRVRLGSVVDFILVHWHDHYFPAFNVADSAITVGAALLILDALLGGSTKLAEGNQGGANG